MADNNSTITLKVDNSDLIEALEKHAKALDRNTNTMLKLKETATPEAAVEPEAKVEPTKTDAKKAEEKKPDPKPAETKKKGPTREDVVKALKDHAALNGKESALAILKDMGADSVSDLDPDKYQDAVDKANEA